MSISEPFIHRPVATTLLTIAIALGGATAYNLLPVSPLPQVDFPYHLSAGQPSRRKPGDHGLVGGDTTRKAVRPYRSGYRDDFG
jgi:hypothetical protein